MFKILFAIFAALCGASLVASRGHWWPARLEAGRVSYSPELLADLLEFVKLIPSVTIDELIAEHMITDSSFRKAAKFVSSSDFKRLQQRAESLPEVIEVINFMHLNDTSIRSRIRIDERLRQQLIDNAHKTYGYEFAGGPTEDGVDEDVVVVLLPVTGSSDPVTSAPNLGSFVSFTQELLTHLPRDRFVALINEKRKSGKVFPKFYEAIRSEQFEPLLEKTMKSQNVINIIKTLASHEIDAEALKRIALEVISWGPK